jgi:hypothetical protein
MSIIYACDLSLYFEVIIFGVGDVDLIRYNTTNNNLMGDNMLWFYPV